MSTIPLAKGFTPKKLEYPVILSEKYDGVPIAVTVTVDDTGTPLLPATRKTRQGEDCVSAFSIVTEWVVNNLSFFEGFPGQHTVVGELFQTGNPRAPFKDTSGIVRRQVDQGKLLSWGLFDYFWDGGGGNDNAYIDRFTHFCDKMDTTEHVFCIPFYTVRDEEELNATFEVFTRDNPKAEGMVARSATDVFNPGKRSWGYQKMLYEPTVDLRIVRVEEATTADGEPKGMVGRLVASYKGTEIGIGPGRLTHAERIELWEQYQREASYCCCGSTVDHYPDGHSPVRAADYYGFPNRIAQIKYKADESYDALRQPTFQHWRDDKTEPDA